MKKFKVFMQKLWRKLVGSRPEGTIDGIVAISIISVMYLISGVIIMLAVNDMPCVFCIMANVIVSSWYVWTWRR